MKQGHRSNFSSCPRIKALLRNLKAAVWKSYPIEKKLGKEWLRRSVCEKCYARRGYYAQPRVQQCLERRFLALRHPGWVPAMAELITKCECSGYFRWHDSGDLQGLWHLRQIAQVCG